MSQNLKPQAREAGLVIEELDDELLVYDLERHKAHCLNSTAALVWRHCDGKTSAQSIASRIRNEAQIPMDDEVVWVALRRLGKANLLSEKVPLPKAFQFGSTRRDLLKKLALVGGLSVVTIISPTAAEAATHACKTNVSCKHICISDHNKTSLPCPGGTADEENGKCCSNNVICAIVSNSSPGVCSPNPACVCAA